MLVLWALTSGYLCVPRSGSKSKIERTAIFENSYEGIKDYSLTMEEFETLNKLDEGLTAGRLGVVDGWEENDIVNERWDPTTFV